MKRLRAAPEAVQEAVGLASAQGMQFLPKMVTEMGADLAGHHLAEHLAAAEDPYSMVLGARSKSCVGMFSERIVHEVATKHRRSLTSLGGEQRISKALRERLCTLLDHPSPDNIYSEDELLVAYRLALLEFGETNGMPDKKRFEEASVRLIALERNRGSHESAAIFETKLYQIKPEPVSEEFVRCWQAAGTHIQSSAKNENLVWFKTDLLPPLMEHFSFRIKNQVFMIRVVDTDGKVDTQGTVSGLIHHALQWQGIPCLLPMKFVNGAWNPTYQGWGLVHAKDNKPISPIEVVGDDPVEMTDWELYDFAVMCVKNYIEETLGKQVVNYCNNPHVSPSIFFEGDKGLEWVVVRVARDEKGGKRPEDAIVTQAMLRDHGYPIGHFASLGIVSAEGPSCPLIRGAGMQLYFEGFEKFVDENTRLIIKSPQWKKVKFERVSGKP